MFVNPFNKAGGPSGVPSGAAQKASMTPEQAIKDALSDLKEEIQGLKKDPIEKQNKKLANEDNESRDHYQQMRRDGQQSVTEKGQLRSDMADSRPTDAMIEAAMAEEFAGVLSEEDVKKKRRKEKTKFEEKIERFAKLEGVLSGYTPRNDHEKQVISEFFDNISRYRNLSGALKRLFNLETNLSELQKRNQDKKSNSGEG